MTTSYSNDGSGNHTNNNNNNNNNNHHDSANDWEALGETESLLKKKDNDGDEEFGHQETAGFLGTIVEGVEYIAEHAQEAATDLKDAIVDGYENVVEGVEHMAENASEMASEISEAIVEEAVDIKDHFVDDLHEKDDGETCMFEMGLTRNLSLLPQDIEGIAHPKVLADESEQETVLPEVTTVVDCCPQKLQSCFRPKIETETTKLLDDEGHAVYVEKPTGGVPFHAYLTLIGAVICLSSIGPSLDMQMDVASSMKIYWRMTGTYLVLFPFALRSVWKSGFPHLTTTQICTFALAAFCYALTCVSFVLALDYTSVGNAVIFANSQSLLLLVGKLLVGQAVSFMEGSGATIAFGGAILCACDSSASTGNTFSLDTDVNLVWAGVGDLLALLSAIGGVGYLVFAKTLREHVPNVFVFMFMIMLGGSCFVLLYVWISGEVFTFNRDISTGLWGWMNLRSDRLPLELWMVCICNLMGAMGYVRSMQYFDNLIIAVATLMEPVVASFMAFSLKVGLLPNWFGWIGNVLVVIGTVCVIYPNSGGKSAAGAH